MNYVICDEKTRTISNTFKVKDINEFLEFMDYVNAEDELEVLVFNAWKDNTATVQINCVGEIFGILGVENGKHSFDYNYFVMNLKTHLPEGEVMFLSSITEEHYACRGEGNTLVQYRINTHMIMSDGDINFEFEDMFNDYCNMEGFWEGNKNIFPM